MVTIGAASGFSSGLMNTYTVGTAQSIAELPLFSGIWFRAIGLVPIYAIAVFFVMRYAIMVKKDPSKSYMLGTEEEEGFTPREHHEVTLTGRHIGVLLCLLATIIYIAYGIIKWGFYVVELSGAFILLGIVGGLVGGLAPNRIARAFVMGCKDITFGALVCGIGRGILVTLQDGQIIDSIIQYFASVIQMMPEGVSGMVMFWVQSFISIFIPSGSGLAATTMPIMTPLADMTGITRQTAVVAFTYGDGFSNNIIPTSASLMGVLAAAGVPYEKWVKFVWPIVAVWTVFGSIMCFIADIIKLGPF
jgi:uncharacterized ion transporter superfamily protein YfcC